MKKVQVIVLGSGPAGCTASIYCARAGLSTVMFTGDQIGGQLVYADKIDNWPGYPDGINGYELMNNMIKHVEKLGVEVINDSVIPPLRFASPPPFKKVGEIDIENFETKRIIARIASSITPFLERGVGGHGEYCCDALIIATGSTHKKLGLEKEDEMLGKGISYCATCDGYFYKGKKVAVIGGGNTAVSEAIYLSDIAEHVYLIHRRNSFRAEHILVEQLNRKEKEGKISIIYDSIVSDISISNDRIDSIFINNDRERKIDVSCLFVAIGYNTEISIFKDILEIENDHILTGMNRDFPTMSSKEGIFVAGDVCDQRYKQAIFAAGQGCIASLDAIRYISEKSF